MSWVGDIHEPGAAIDMRLIRCETCGALLLQRDVGVHEGWHEDLARRTWSAP